MKVAFIGHTRLGKRANTKLLEKKVEKAVEILITQYGADEFIFGSMIGFGDLCHIVVTQLKEKYPHIIRTYRSQFVLSKKEVQRILNKHFEKCEIPSSDREMGKASHIKRNEKMIDDCDLLITFFDKDYEPRFKYYEEVSYSQKDNNTPPMGITKIALNYAFKRDKKCINLFEE
ncbi:MAG: SLOG family protein [Clostridia bacterium]|nr:SLOG family protein [Clostridia bacterium]